MLRVTFLSLISVLLGCGSTGPALAPPAAVDITTPVVVAEPVAPARAALPGIEGAVDLTVGDEHACVTLAGGEIYCWGSSAQNRLGDNATAARVGIDRAKDRVRGVDAARLVAAGGAMSCAIEKDGEVWCWGGYERHPGVDEENARLPVAERARLVAAPIAGIRQVSAGWSEAVLLDGAGQASILDGYVGPVPLDQFRPAVEVAALHDGFCARGVDGGVQCVTSQEMGALGHGGGAGGWGEEPATVLAPLVRSPEMDKMLYEEDARIPYNACADVEGETKPAFCQKRLSNALDLDAQGGLACAVLADGHVACWGCAEGCWDRMPPLGIGNGPALVPVLVDGIADAKMVAVGGRHVCVLTKANVTKCWGDNFEGQLGDPALPGGETLVVVTGLGDVVELDAGDATTCARRQDGTVVCWGRTLGKRSRQPPEPDEAPPVAWNDLPVATRPEPTESGVSSDHVCQDVDVMVRDGQLETRAYVYDKKGRVIRERTEVQREDGPYQHSVDYTLDAKGRVVAEKARDSEDDTRYRYGYDAEGRMIRKEGGWDSPVTWVWTRRGNEAEGRGSNESVTLIRYDDAGREVWRREAPEPWAPALERTTTWDGNGRVLSERELDFEYPYFDDPTETREFRYTYDEAGRKTQTEELRQDSDGQWVRFRLTKHLYSNCPRR